jgi:polygalacturonase
MHNDDFTVQVREPDGDWQDLYEYKVEVDMDTKSTASMVQFDFAGKAEIRARVNNGTINDVKIRPLANNIVAETANNAVYFSLDKPAKLSLEINGDRLHNLHIFANPLETETFSPEDKEVIYFGEGIHVAPDSTKKTFVIPSGKTVYLAAGAVVRGKFVCDRVENVRFIGRGLIDNPERGFELKFSKNIEIDGITVINPRHYTVFGGQTDGLKIKNLKSFSNRGWSDGVDLMSCNKVDIDDIFMRNSDDCIAIYTHRWNFYGDARNYSIKNAILWADVAHPINIGLHGDTSHEGNVIENLHFSNIDILEHDEDDCNYQGCIAFSVSDFNRVSDVTFENVRIENIQEGQLFNLRLLYNAKYSSGAGRGIENITFRNIDYNGCCENPSVIEGFDESRMIRNISFENIVINGKRIKSFEEAGIKVGKFTGGITVK